MPRTAKKQVVRGAVSREVFGQGRTETRAGLYARISTHDQQTLPMQLAAMREYARKRGWTVAIEVQEVASGAKDRPERGSSPIRAKTCGSVLCAMLRGRLTRAKGPVSSPPMASGSGISRNLDP